MTKIISLALAAAAISASAAAADSFIPFTAETQERDSVIELGTVTSEGNGVVEIYSFNTGEIGDLLGSEMLSNGANANVRVNLGKAPVTDVIAQLKVDGVVVDSQEIDFQ